MKSHHTSRRNFVRGMSGAALAIPWMESLSKSSEPIKPSVRAAWFYVPIGVVRRGFFPGEDEAAIPKFNGSRTEVKNDARIKVGTHELKLTPTQKPLERMKEKITFITGLDRTFQEGTDVHAQCASCFLTNSAPHTITQSPYPQSRTLDHIVAEKIGRDTPFRTLEFSCNSHKDNKESIQFDNISWYGTEHVAPSMRDPRKVYHRLFGTQEGQSNKNITDLVLEDARSMQRHLGYDDKQKFSEYFDSIRTIEEQMERLEKLRDELSFAKFEEPLDAHLPRGEYIRLMGDLMVTALQVGLTNVATFMVGPERWDTPYMYETLFEKPRSHHQMSHNQGRFIEDLLRVDHFHMEQFAYLVEKMDSIKEADGTTLLDNTLFTYGSGLGDGSTHQYSALPIIMAGSGGGKLITGKHINLSDHSGAVPKKEGKYQQLYNGLPLANLWLTQAKALGLEMDRYAESTGEISHLMA